MRESVSFTRKRLNAHYLCKARKTQIQQLVVMFKAMMSTGFSTGIVDNSGFSFE
jgi:hypothetical protein